jgi:hypothetical protein
LNMRLNPELARNMKNLAAWCGNIRRKPNDPKRCILNASRDPTFNHSN